MNEVTRYRNEINTIPMRNWTAEEQDFFFAIITEARDKATQLIVFEKEELKDLADYNDRNNKRFVDTIESLGKKIASMNYYEKKKNSFKIMNLFQRFEVEWSDDYSEMHAEIRVSEDFEYILNKLEANFTQFELKHFTNIRSTYAKEMFKKLKQWRSIGKKEYPVEEFRAMLQVPKSYRATDINQVVLKPIKEELSDYFVGLRVKPIKVRKRGNPIISYEFTWKPEEAGTWIDGKYEKKKRKDVTDKKKTRKETLPEWAQEGYVPPKEKRLSKEDEESFKKRLEEIRKNRSKR